MTNSYDSTPMAMSKTNQRIVSLTLSNCKMKRNLAIFLQMENTSALDTKMECLRCSSFMITMVNISRLSVLNCSISTGNIQYNVLNSLQMDAS
jgi:hypothetical protein